MGDIGRIESISHSNRAKEGFEIAGEIQGAYPYHVYTDLVN